MATTSRLGPRSAGSDGDRDGGAGGQPLGQGGHEVLQQADLDDLHPGQAAEHRRDGVAGQRAEGDAEQPVAGTGHGRAGPQGGHGHRQHMHSLGRVPGHRDGQGEAAATIGAS
jgi:hypothetical protein